MNRKFIVLSLLSLIILSCLAYISFYAIKIHMLSTVSKEESKEFKYHILTGVVDKDDEFTKDFYAGVQYISSIYDGVVELLEIPAGTTSVYKEWMEYARMVDCDGLVIFSMDENFVPRILKGPHEKSIPVVSAGICSSKKGEAAGRICSNQKEFCRTAYEEILKGGWKKPVAFLHCINTIEETNLIIEDVNSLLDQGMKIKKQTLLSGDVVDDEIRVQLVNYSRTGEGDLILCFTSEDANLVAQTLIDQNLTDRLSIISFYGDSKTREYLTKGIVSAIIYIDAWDYGTACGEELFEWKITGKSDRIRQISPKLISGAGR